MGVVFIGCGVVWAAVTVLTHGNWAAGLMVAAGVMWLANKGQQVEQAVEAQPANPRRVVIAVEEDQPDLSVEEPRRWF